MSLSRFAWKTKDTHTGIIAGEPVIGFVKLFAGFHTLREHLIGVIDKLLIGARIDALPR